MGNAKTVVIYTPGITPDSSCFLVQTIDDSKDICIFTGDTVLIEGIGRPELSIREKVKLIEYSSLLFDSIQRLK